MNTEKFKTSYRSFAFLSIGTLLGVIIGFSFAKTQNAKLENYNGIALSKVDGKILNSNQLPENLVMEYYNLEESIYAARKNMALQISLKVALNRDLGENQNFLPIEQLLKLPPISEKEAREYYNSTVARMGSAVFGGQSFEKLKPQLISQLNYQRISLKSEEKIKELQESGRIELMLTPPVGPPLNLSFANLPVRGKGNSDNTFIHIGDWASLTARDSEYAVERLYQNYSRKMKFVTVVYPESGSGISIAFARGAYCSHLQGNNKFWEFHKQVMSIPYETMKNYLIFDTDQALTQASEIAKNTNIDNKAFSQCLTSVDAIQYVQDLKNQLSPMYYTQNNSKFYLNRKPLKVASHDLSNSIRKELNF